MPREVPYIEMNTRQVTFLLFGKAKDVFATLRACKGIHGNFYRKVVQ